ncbi:MAG: hypothetical protein AAGA85_04015 [Bacteroidota bacterium]
MDTLLEYDTASLLVDFPAQCLMIKWRGDVNFDEYQAVLVKATEMVEVHDIQHVIIDRLELRSLNTECRVWMKNYFLKKLVRPIIPKLTKVASIESRSAIGQVYAKTISKTVSLAYPNLTFQSFIAEQGAHEWINAECVRQEKEPVLVTSADRQLKITASQNNDLRSVDLPQLEQKRNHLMESLYQLFFANR